MITVISGTNRKGSNSLLVAKKYCELLLARGIECKLLDLKELPSDFIHSDMFGYRTPKTLSVIEDYIEPAHHFVFVLPEYHSSYPGIVKLLLDGIESYYFKDKNAALVGVSSGRQGNARGLDAMGNVLNYLQMEVLSKKVKISGIEKLINQDTLSDQNTISSLEKQIERMMLKWHIQHELSKTEQ